MKTIFYKKIKTPRQMCANDIIKLTQFSSIWWDIQLIAVFASFQEVFKMCQMNIAVHLMYWGAYNVATKSPFPYDNIIIPHKISFHFHTLLCSTHHEYFKYSSNIHHAFLKFLYRFNRLIDYTFCTMFF